VSGQESGGPDADGTVVPAEAAFTQAVPRSSPARAHRHRRARKLSLLRLGEAVEAGRGYHRDAGGDPAAVEGDPDGAGKVLVPGMREDHATAGTAVLETRFRGFNEERPHSAIGNNPPVELIGRSAAYGPR
jgi:transposase InsO family protein